MKKLPLCVLLWDVWHCKVSNQQMKLSSWLSTFCKDGHKRTNKPLYHHRRNARALDNLQQFDARYSGQCSLNTSEQCLLWKLKHLLHFRFRGMLACCVVSFGWMLPCMLKPAWLSWVTEHSCHQHYSISASFWAAQPAPVRIRLWWERNHLQKASKCLDVLCPFVQLILTTQSLSIVHVDPWFSMRDQLSLDNAIARPSELLLV